MENIIIQLYLQLTVVIFDVKNVQKVEMKQITIVMNVKSIIIQLKIQNILLIAIKI